MSRRTSLLLAGLIVGVSAVALVASLVIDTSWSRAAQGFGGLVFALAGGFVGVRARTNRVGWLLAFSGVLIIAVAFFEAYGVAGLAHAEWAAWLASLLFLPAFLAVVVFVPFLFPEGRSPNDRWNWLVWNTLIGMLFFWSGNAFNEEFLDDYGLANPLQIDLPALLITVFQGAAVLLLAVGIVAGVSAAVLRFRGSQGVPRQQMKWFTASAVLLIPAVVFNGWAYESGRASVGVPVFALLVSALPVSIGMAVLKYQLYEIDRIISRTVSYSVVAGLLTLVFATGVVWVPSVLDLADSPLVVAASTLAVAALFNPLRKRVQVLVDRRFNRSRYDAERVMAAFAGLLRGGSDPAGIIEGCLGVVAQTMQPSSLGVWVRELAKGPVTNATRETTASSFYPKSD